MYPLSAIPSGNVATGEGMLQDTTKQRGTFVEVKGWGDVLEGASRRELSAFAGAILVYSSQSLYSLYILV